MKRREIYLGVVIAAALTIGVVMARDGDPGATNAAGDERVAAELDITTRDGSVMVGDLTVTVRSEPRPLRAFGSARYSFGFFRGTAPVAVTNPRVSFNMTMDMGPHDYRLIAGERGQWLADGVILPQCASGSRLWFGTLTFGEGGEKREVRLRLELEPPRYGLMRESLDLVGFLTLGLLGGFGHCVGMCGPFVLYISRRFGTPEASRGAVLWQQGLYGLGRLTTYAALGIAAGALGQAVDLAGSILGFQRVAAVIAGGLLILYALLSLIDLLPFLASTGGSLFARVAGVLRSRSPNNAFITGLLLGFLPCGLVYSAVIAAAGRGGAVEGGVGLLLFGAGTLPAMLGLSVVDELLARHRRIINRLSIFFLLVMGGWFVWQGLSAG